MRLITLNTWAGRFAHKLIPFLVEEARAVDVICLQEVMDVSESETKKPEWKELSRMIDQDSRTENPRTLDLYERIKKVLPEFNSHLSTSYSSADERLAMFVKKDLI